MIRSVRQLLVATLIALHAAVTLCGPGLHALPGLGHHLGFHRLARNDHSHGPGKSSHESADDCLVCHFLAQGQIRTGASAGAMTWLVARVAPPRLAIFGSTTPQLPSIPRAPPA